MGKTLSILTSAAITILLTITHSGFAFEEDIIAAWLMDEGSGKVVKDYMGNFSDSEIADIEAEIEKKIEEAIEFAKDSPEPSVDEFLEEVAAVREYGGEGIGLYRTEILYLRSKGLPAEGELFEDYKQLKILFHLMLFLHYLLLCKNLSNQE